MATWRRMDNHDPPARGGDAQETTEQLLEEENERAWEMPWHCTSGEYGWRAEEERAEAARRWPHLRSVPALHERRR